MTARDLIITPAVTKDLQLLQLDALELAALDTFYVLKICSLDAATQRSLHGNPKSMVICSAAEAAALLNDGSLSPLQTIVLNFGDERSEAIREGLGQSGLLFIMGATSPALMRGMLGSILEFCAARGHRGLLPRLASANTMTTKRFRIESSDQRAAAQQFTTSCVRQAYEESSRLQKMPITATDGSWPWPGSSFTSKAVSDILDELMMNAIWDAHPAYRNLPRTDVCRLTSDQEVHVECASDGLTLAVSVEDTQGTFPWNALRGPLAFVLGLKPDLKVNEGPGGAGLGLFMILQRTSILTIEVSRGNSTRVSSLLRIDDSARDMQARPKSLLVFSRDIEGHPGAVTSSTEEAS